MTERLKSYNAEMMKAGLHQPIKTDRLPLPLPLPARYPEEGTGGIDYTAKQMREYSDAENAALTEAQRWLMANNKMLQQTIKEQGKKVRALREALQHIERVMGPKVPPCCDGCHFEWGEALKKVRAALEATK